MFDPVDEMLPVVTVPPAEQRAKKKMRPIFSVSALTCRCLQTLIFISAREEKNRSFLSILRITPHAWALPNPGTVHFIALWSGEGPTGQSSGTSIGKVTWSLEDRRDDPGLHVCFGRTMSQNRKQVPFAHTHAHRCLQLQYRKEGRLNRDLRDCCGKIFVSCKLTPLPNA